ncbi:hypothetical protein BV134_1622 [Haemophilus influenzae]|nr:hypothetical protein BV131_1506 [Haemophilus influenzae]AVJ05646.1 hypothetical protein BV134_1622 [Haemophilus influenzae]
MNVVYTAYKSSSNFMLIFAKNKHNHTLAKYSFTSGVIVKKVYE